MSISPRSLSTRLRDNRRHDSSRHPALQHKLRTVAPLLCAETIQPMPSPCVSVCRMDDAQQYCLGCLRTLDELRAWGSADDATKRQIWLHIRERCKPTT